MASCRPSDAMMRLNSDLVNLLDSTQIATVFLDDALRIKHYRPAMEGLFSIRDVDRGRPILAAFVASSCTTMPMH